MKQCPKCTAIKPVSEFNKNKAKPDGLQRICRVCSREADRKSYKKTFSEQPKIRLDRNKSTRLRKMEWLNNHRKPGCAKCGESRIHVIDFHHIDPSQKEFSIGDNQANYEMLKEEIKKCVLLCSNCHRDFHYLERRENMTIEVYLEK
jgi:hypothetical protein